MSDHAEIDAELARIRRLRARAWLIWLGYLPTVVSLVLTLKLCGIEENTAAPLVSFPYLVLFGAAGLRVAFARCPRCRERFHARLFWQNPWTRACLHCGLAIQGARASNGVGLSPIVYRSLAALMLIGAFGCAGAAGLVAFATLPSEQSTSRAVFVVVLIGLAVVAAVLARRLLRAAEKLMRIR